jgi:hypothetical protein
MRGTKAKRLRVIRDTLVADGARPPRRLRKLAPWLRQMGRR